MKSMENPVKMENPMENPMKSIKSPCVPFKSQCKPHYINPIKSPQIPSNHHVFPINPNVNPIKPHKIQKDLNVFL